MKLVKHLKASKETFGLKIQKNLPLVKNGDLVKRNLDCAVIETFPLLGLVCQFTCNIKKS
jgi:hypothetical protein